MLQQDFDRMAFGVHMPVEKLRRFLYLLKLTRLPLDEDFRCLYKRKVTMAIDFREDFEYLRWYLKKNGYGEFERSTLVELERQRHFLSPCDNKLAEIIRLGLDAWDKGELVARSTQSLEGGGYFGCGSGGDDTRRSGSKDRTGKKKEANGGSSETARRIMAALEPLREVEEEDKG